MDGTHNPWYMILSTNSWHIEQEPMIRATKHEPMVHVNEHKTMRRKLHSIEPKPTDRNTSDLTQRHTNPYQKQPVKCTWPSTNFRAKHHFKQFNQTNQIKQTKPREPEPPYTNRINQVTQTINMALIMSKIGSCTKRGFKASCIRYNKIQVERMVNIWMYYIRILRRKEVSLYVWCKY